MSVHVWIGVQVEGLDRFLSVFQTSGSRERAAHGCRSARVFHVVDDPVAVRVLLEWDDLAAFYAFAAAEDRDRRISESGVMGRPAFEVLECVADLEA